MLAAIYVLTLTNFRVVHLQDLEAMNVYQPNRHITTGGVQLLYVQKRLAKAKYQCIINSRSA